MLDTDWQKRAREVRETELTFQKEREYMETHGWSYEGSENGGPLWELDRGDRKDHIITDVKIAVHGKGIYFRTVGVK